MDKGMEKDAQDLRTAMKGMGTNEAEIIRITMSHTKKERQTLRLAYKTCFGRDLMEDLSKELSGNFKDTILALYEDPIEYDAKCLYKAMKGLGTDEDTLIEIICTRPNWMLKAISEVFLKLYKKELTKWVESETSGDFRRILLSLLQCNRSENTHPNDDGFSPMIIKGFAYDDKKEAGQAILDACTAMKSPEAVPLGQYRGFDMGVSFDTFNFSFIINYKWY